MISIQSFFGSSARKRSPALNTNHSGDVRALTGPDMKAIIDAHGPAIGAAIDQKAASFTPDSNRPLTLIDVVWTLPELQRWIVCFGTSLKWQAALEMGECRQLPEACLEVMIATRAEYSDEAFLTFLTEHLSRHSEYVADGGLRR